MMAPAAEAPATSRRAIAFVLVLVVHAVLIYAFNAGLTDIIVDKVLGNLQTVDIAAPEEEEEQPPPPPPKIEQPPPFVPPPDIVIESAPVENTTAIQSVTNVRPAEPPPPVTAPRASVDVGPKLNPRRMPGSSDEYYPQASRRAEEEGTVIVQVHVAEDGKIDDVKVQTSCGFPRLDEAAIKYVRSWPRLVPGTRDGKPVAMNASFKVKFELKGGR
jgi:periplasmic protein TonB